MLSQTTHSLQQWLFSSIVSILSYSPCPLLLSRLYVHQSVDHKPSLPYPQHALLYLQQSLLSLYRPCLLLQCLLSSSWWNTEAVYVRLLVALITRLAGSSGAATISCWHDGAQGRNPGQQAKIMETDGAGLLTIGPRARNLPGTRSYFGWFWLVRLLRLLSRLCLLWLIWLLWLFWSCLLAAAPASENLAYGRHWISWNYWY